MNSLLMRENFIVHLMNLGFGRAAGSFSKFIGKPVKITNTKSVLIRHDDDFSYISEEEGNLYVLVTQIVGNLYGKSYLIFNETECNDIYRLIGRDDGVTDKMKEAILMELDNIISASVISELSDTLKLDIYGDVPMLKKMHAFDLQEFVSKDTNETNPSSVIFTNTTFQFDHHQEVHPQFIWKISTKIFDKVPSERLVLK